jgi:hypothetical protein
LSVCNVINFDAFLLHRKINKQIIIFDHAAQAKFTMQNMVKLVAICLLFHMISAIVVKNRCTIYTPLFVLNFNSVKTSVTFTSYQANRRIILSKPSQVIRLATNTFRQTISQKLIATTEIKPTIRKHSWTERNHTT